MRKSPFRAVLAAFAACACAAAGAETVVWYRSDGAGIAYEQVSKPVALRAEWALEVRLQDAGEAEAGSLMKGERRETKSLYARGEKKRTTVSYLDPSLFARFVETDTGDGASSKAHYDAQRRLVDETTVEKDGSGIVVRYTWFADRLVKASAFALDASDGDPLWIDTYRYDRSGALVSVSREPDKTVFTQNSRGGAPRFLEFRAADGSVARTSFDKDGREEETAAIDPSGKTVGSLRYSYVKAEESGKSLASSRSGKGDAVPREISYDEQGRVVREAVLDSNGKIVEETRNEWKGDRISTVTRTAGDQVRKTEFAYDARGNRVGEKNYLNGRLERTVSKEGTMEIEELFKNGARVLRASYEGGVLVKEERDRPPASGEGDR